MKFWNDSYTCCKKKEILQLHSFFFFFANIVFCCGAMHTQRVWWWCTRKGSAIDYSGLRHKASLECHTRSASAERLSRQFSSVKQDSTGNPPRARLWNIPGRTPRPSSELKWDLWSGRAGVSQGSKVTPLMRTEKSVKWAFEPLWSLLMSHWSLMLKDSSDTLIHI